MDGDGDLDLLTGNYGQTNQLYLNNGTADPFSAVTGSNISSDVSIPGRCPGGCGWDGDLDLVAANFEQVNRLYLNNGTADPFNSVTGIKSGSDAHYTYSRSGDVAGDSDLDLLREL